MNGPASGSGGSCAPFNPYSELRYVPVFEGVSDLPGVTPAVGLLYGILATFGWVRDEDGNRHWKGECNPSVGRIIAEAKKLGRSWDRKWISKATKTLEQAGALEMDRAPNRLGKATRYVFRAVHPRGLNASGCTQPRGVADPGVQSTATPGVQSTASLMVQDPIGSHTATSTRRIPEDLPEESPEPARSLALALMPEPAEKPASPKRLKKKRSKRLETAIEHPDVQAVIEYYRQALKPGNGWDPETKVNHKPRAVAVLQRLEAGYTVESIKRAIDGMAQSEWHRENGHTDLELAVREDKIDGLMARAQAPRKTHPAVPSDFSQAPDANSQVDAILGGVA